MRVAFKVSRNPSAAGGGWRSARGLLGLWLLRFSHRSRFLTLGFNFVVAARGTLRGSSQGWWEPVRVPSLLTRRAGPGLATQESPLPRAQRLLLVGDLGSPGSRGTNIWCAARRALSIQGLLPPPGLSSRSRLCSYKNGLWGDQRFDEDAGTQDRLGYLYLRLFLGASPLSPTLPRAMSS